MKRKNEIQPLDEVSVQTVARIIGPSSAAAKALARAEELRAEGETPFFFRNSGGICVMAFSAVRAAASLQDPQENRDV
jgi:hypothetical protein